MSEAKRYSTDGRPFLEIASRGGKSCSASDRPPNRATSSATRRVSATSPTRQANCAEPASRTEAVSAAP